MFISYVDAGPPSARYLPVRFQSGRFLPANPSGRLLPQKPDRIPPASKRPTQLQKPLAP